jgi:hypothetical protein
MVDSDHPAMPERSAELPRLSVVVPTLSERRRRTSETAFVKLVEEVLLFPSRSVLEKRGEDLGKGDQAHERFDVKYQGKSRMR